MGSAKKRHPSQNNECIINVAVAYGYGKVSVSVKSGSLRERIQSESSWAGIWSTLGDCIGYVRGENVPRSPGVCTVNENWPTWGSCWKTTMAGKGAGECTKPRIHGQGLVLKYFGWLLIKLHLNEQLWWLWHWLQNKDSYRCVNQTFKYSCLYSNTF